MNRMMTASGVASQLPPLLLQRSDGKATFRYQAYGTLKKAIMDADSHARREGIRVDEGQLSQALDVRRTPIREAMTLVEQEEFLRTLPRRVGFIVRRTTRQVGEMIEIWTTSPRVGRPPGGARYPSLGRASTKGVHRCAVMKGTRCTKR